MTQTQKRMRNIQPGQIWYVEGEDDQTKWRRYVLEKTRPHLVIAVHGGNINCIPVTSSANAKYYNIVLERGGNNFVISQLTCKSRDEFKSYVTTISKDILEEVKQKVAEALLSEDANWFQPISKKNMNRGTVPQLLRFDMSKEIQLANKTVPGKIVYAILRDYQEKPMSALLNDYRRYNITKRDIYMIMINYTLDKT